MNLDPGFLKEVDDKFHQIIDKEMGFLSRVRLKALSGLHKGISSLANYFDKTEEDKLTTFKFNNDAHSVKLGVITYFGPMHGINLNNRYQQLIAHNPKDNIKTITKGLSERMDARLNEEKLKGEDKRPNMRGSFISWDKYVEAKNKTLDHPEYTNLKKTKNNFWSYPYEPKQNSKSWSFSDYFNFLKPQTSQDQTESGFCGGMNKVLLAKGALNAMAGSIPGIGGMLKPALEAAHTVSDYLNGNDDINSKIRIFSQAINASTNQSSILADLINSHNCVPDSVRSLINIANTVIGGDKAVLAGANKIISYLPKVLSKTSSMANELIKKPLALGSNLINWTSTKIFNKKPNELAINNNIDEINKMQTITQASVPKGEPKINTTNFECGDCANKCENLRIKNPEIRLMCRKCKIKKCPKVVYQTVLNVGAQVSQEDKEPKLLKRKRTRKP